MDIYFASYKVLMERIGEKIRHHRIASHMTQKMVAQQAAVSLSAVAAIEKGNNTSLLTLIQVLRTIQCLELLEPFFREEPISPIAIADAMRKQRTPKRVRKPKTIHPISSTSNPETEW